ncbi:MULTISPECIES: GDSL-type esterase/lipase family protein [unclassified Nitrobacter]|uniref:GDSL-type esterase/lipase family protein n=1 Tax=unclassified Nitrobacter TaxID=2620411 RepID=UPI000926EE93|nr:MULTISPECIES: GDSL-type esterase/lipase family protein [unclassified Nitrobacter]MBN9148989.1 SGNH/GDSL hydrolase family protein [Nitrobacter sp.]OJU99787.1 MAG: lipolytic enzyme [Nitrobacter sp. 62-23]
MRAGWMSVLFVMAGLSASALARADDPPQSCDVPAYLLTSDSPLPRVSAAIKAGGPLAILVVGSRSSTIAGAEGEAYPARLQAMLREKLPGIAVSVSMELAPRKTAADVAPGLGKLAQAKKPTLVVWQTGTVDAIRSVDVDSFHDALDQGVTALQNAGADVVLMNMQYSPRTETMVSPTSYIDNMRVVAQQHDVPLFDRFAIMNRWNETGEFDLFSAVRGVGLAKRVHDCLGRALSAFVIDTAHVNPAELGTRRR